MLTTRLREVVVRRWIVVVIGVLITAGMMWGATQVIAPDQSVTATVLLLPPATSGTDGTSKTNPYLELGGLTSPVEVLARALNDPKVHDAVVSSSKSSDYVAERDVTTSAPVLLITVQDPSLGKARAVRDELLKRTPQILSNLQSSIGVPKTSQLTSDVLTSEGQPETQSKRMIRALLAVLILGLGLTLLAAGVVDALLAPKSGQPRRPGRPAAMPGAQPVAFSAPTVSPTSPARVVSRPRAVVEEPSTVESAGDESVVTENLANALRALNGSTPARVNAPARPGSGPARTARGQAPPRADVH